MRLTTIDQIRGDEILARPLFDIQGRKLLSAGVSLRPSILNKLYEKGITSVYVEDHISEGIEITGLLCEETRTQAKLIVKEEMQRLSRNKEIDFYKISAIVDSIIDEILSQNVDIINIKDIRMQDEYTFAHSVNVCVMAIALAVKLSIPVPKIKSIATGALLHDLGKAFLPQSLLQKTEGFTEEEIIELEKHPVLGYNIVKDYNEVAATTKISILMHHEHFDGTGYPMKIAGDKIHYSARIITICNEFDNTINDRYNRNLLNTTNAVEYIIGASGYIFDKALASEFLKMIPIYCEGSIVLLSNGTVAIVVKNNPGFLTRPVVRVFYHPKTKTKFNKSYIIDLKHELSIKILREIKTSQLWNE